jgi:hypothetical protein
MSRKLFFYKQESSLITLAKEWLQEQYGFESASINSTDAIETGFVALVFYDVLSHPDYLGFLQTLVKKASGIIILINCNEHENILLPKGFKEEPISVSVFEKVPHKELVKYRAQMFKVDTRGSLQSPFGKVIAKKGEFPVALIYKSTEAAAPIIVTTLTLEFPSGGTSAVDLGAILNHLVLEFKDNANLVLTPEPKDNSYPYEEMSVEEMLSRWKMDFLNCINLLSQGSLEVEQEQYKDIIEHLYQLNLINKRGSYFTVNSNFQTIVLDNPRITPFLRRFELL